jgi:hypothetical protein
MKEFGDLDYVELVQSMVKLAKLNRTLYEAYVEQGFTEDQALKLLIAHISETNSRRKS